jgi:hypothetical protein
MPKGTSQKAASVVGWTPDSSSRSGYAAPHVGAFFDESVELELTDTCQCHPATRRFVYSVLLLLLIAGAGSASLMAMSAVGDYAVIDQGGGLSMQAICLSRGGIVASAVFASALPLVFYTVFMLFYDWRLVRGLCKATGPKQRCWQDLCCSKRPLVVLVVLLDGFVLGSSSVLFLLVVNLRHRWLTGLALNAVPMVAPLVLQFAEALFSRNGPGRSLFGFCWGKDRPRCGLRWVRFVARGLGSTLLIAALWVMLARDATLGLQFVGIELTVILAMNAVGLLLLRSQITGGTAWLKLAVPSCCPHQSETEKYTRDKVSRARGTSRYDMHRPLHDPARFEGGIPRSLGAVLRSAAAVVAALVTSIFLWTVSPIRLGVEDNGVPIVCDGHDWTYSFGSAVWSFSQGPLQALLTHLVGATVFHAFTLEAMKAQMHMLLAWAYAGMIGVSCWVGYARPDWFRAMFLGPIPLWAPDPVFSSVSSHMVVVACLLAGMVVAGLSISRGAVLSQAQEWVYNRLPWFDSISIVSFTVINVRRPWVVQGEAKSEDAPPGLEEGMRPLKRLDHTHLLAESPRETRYGTMGGSESHGVASPGSVGTTPPLTGVGGRTTDAPRSRFFSYQNDAFDEKAPSVPSLSIGVAGHKSEAKSVPERIPEQHPLRIAGEAPSDDDDDEDDEQDQEPLMMRLGGSRTPAAATAAAAAASGTAPEKPLAGSEWSEEPTVASAGARPENIQYFPMVPEQGGGEDPFASTGPQVREWLTDRVHTLLTGAPKMGELSRFHTYITGCLYNEDDQEIRATVDSFLRVCKDHISTATNSFQTKYGGLACDSLDIDLVVDNALVRPYLPKEPTEGTPSAAMARIPNARCQALFRILKERYRAFMGADLSSTPVFHQTDYGLVGEWQLLERRDFDPIVRKVKKLCDTDAALSKRWDTMHPCFEAAILRMVGIRLRVHLKDSALCYRGKRTNQVLLYNLICAEHNAATRHSSTRDGFWVPPPMENCFLMCFDADTRYDAKGVARLRLCLERDPLMSGVCGLVEPVWSLNPLVLAQYVEYLASHMLGKSFEMFTVGSVSCLPGCFSMWRLSDLERLLPAFSENIDDAMSFLCLAMGEDRFLCTLALRRGCRLGYAPQATARTRAPESIGEFVRQRARWQSSTLANMFYIIAVANTVPLPLRLYAYWSLFSYFSTVGGVLLVNASLLQAIVVMDFWLATAIASLPTVGLLLLQLWNGWERHVVSHGIERPTFGLVMSQLCARVACGYRQCIRCMCIMNPETTTREEARAQPTTTMCCCVQLRRIGLPEKGAQATRMQAEHKEVEIWWIRWATLFSCLLNVVLVFLIIYDVDSIWSKDANSSNYLTLLSEPLLALVATAAYVLMTAMRSFNVLALVMEDLCFLVLTPLFFMYIPMFQIANTDIVSWGVRDPRSAEFDRAEAVRWGTVWNSEEQALVSMDNGETFVELAVQTDPRADRFALEFRRETVREATFSPMNELRVHVPRERAEGTAGRTALDVLRQVDRYNDARVELIAKGVLWPGARSQRTTTRETDEQVRARQLRTSESLIEYRGVMMRTMLFVMLALLVAAGAASVLPDVFAGYKVNLVTWSLLAAFAAQLLASVLAMVCTWLQGQRCIVSEAYAHLTEGADTRFSQDRESDRYQWQRFRLRSLQGQEANTYSVLGE